MNSASAELFAPPPAKDLGSDRFISHSYASYLQYTLLLGSKLELDLALRMDHLRVNWLDLENKVEDTIYAPRLQMLHNLNPHLSQRLSYGLGYRSPLTFFESQHGNNEYGYEVDITDLEKAHSLVYSISYNQPTHYITGGIHYTLLENMAFGLENHGQPIQYINAQESFNIWVTDLLLGYKPTPWWFVETVLEFFQYEPGYQRRLPTAAIEERFQLKSEIKSGPWNHLLRLTVVGARELSPYGSYRNHFVNQSQNSNSDPITPEQKDQRAPLWWTLDTHLSYQFKKSLSLSLGANNLFNYNPGRSGG